VFEFHELLLLDDESLSPKNPEDVEAFESPKGEIVILKKWIQRKRSCLICKILLLLLLYAFRSI
jgi:hypothetical protein